MTKKRLILAAAVAGVLCLAPSAHADWLFTPYAGANTGGSTVQSQPNYGISAAWMGAGIIGWEFDAGWAKDFFDTGATEKNRLITDSSVSTYMFNVIVGAPAGGQSGKGVRPYGSAGIGAIHSEASSALGLVDLSKTDFGWNAGAGAYGFFSDNLGVRGDVRYLQNARNELKDNALFADAGRFGFWRLSAGVVFRFGGQ